MQDQPLLVAHFQSLTAQLYSITDGGLICKSDTNTVNIHIPFFCIMHAIQCNVVQLTSKIPPPPHPSMLLGCCFVDLCSVFRSHQLIIQLYNSCIDLYCCRGYGISVWEYTLRTKLLLPSRPPTILGVYNVLHQWSMLWWNTVYLLLSAR